MKISIKLIALFSLVSLFTFGENENIKMDIGFSGYYTPGNSFSGEAGLYSNPSKLIYAEDSNVAVNFSMPFLATNDLLNGEGFFGKLLKLDVDINKELRDKVSDQEEELMDNDDENVEMKEINLFDPNSKISAGFMPAINGVNLIMKEEKYVLGFGYNKASVKMKLMANDIGGTFKLDYDTAGDSEDSDMKPISLDMNMKLNTNTEITNEYQKISFGGARRLKKLGMSVGAGMDYHSLYTKINSKVNGRIKLTIDGKEGDDILFDYDNIYRNEINSPVYKFGTNFDWKILKWGLSYNIYKGGELDRYKEEAILNQGDELDEQIKNQFPEYWDTEGDKIKVMAAAADLREEANDILGVMFEKGTPTTYKTNFQKNTSYKLSGMLDFGKIMKIGMDMEKYSDPLWQFKITESDLKTDAESLKDIDFFGSNVVADTYNLDTIYKIYGKLLFLDGNVIIVSATGENEGEITLPVAGNLGTGFSIKDYDFKLGMSAGSGIGITSQVKYNF